jgi:hypothetical protein
MVLAFAGRRPGSESFPGESIDRVAAEVERTIASLGPRLAVGSAAAGADLLAAEACLRAGAAIEILIPAGRNRFRAESVADKGGRWGEAFDALVDSALVTVREVPREDDDDASYRAVTAAIAERAQELAEDGEGIALLAISSPREGGVDHTEELVAIAAARNWLVLRIDSSGPPGKR